MSWIKAVHEVKDKHQYCMVHIPTGNKVTQRKTNLYLDIYEEIEDLQSEGYINEQIIRISPNTKKISESDCILVDAITAGVLCCIYDALTKPELKEKFDNMKIDKAVTIGWKLYKKCKRCKND